MKPCCNESSCVEPQFSCVFWIFRFDSEYSAVCNTAVTSRMIGLRSPLQSGHGQQLGPRDCSGVSPVFAGQRGRKRLQFCPPAAKLVSQVLPLNPCHGPDAPVHMDFWKIKEQCFCFFQRGVPVNTTLKFGDIDSE